MKGKTIGSLIFGLFVLFNSTCAQTVSWEDIGPHPFQQRQATSIVFAKGKFVAASPNLIYSEDGLAWRDCHGQSPTAYFAHIAFGNGVFVASGGTNVVYSEDGIAWTASSVLADQVAFGDGKFMALGKDLSTSTNGRDWTSLPVFLKYGGDGVPPFGTALAYGNGLWVALLDGLAPYSTHRVAASPDGVSWTIRTLTNFYTQEGCNNARCPVLFDTVSVVFAKGQFYMAGPGGSYVTFPGTQGFLKSSDGLDWEIATDMTPTEFALASGTRYAAQGIAFGNGVYADTLQQSGLDPEHLSRSPVGDGISISDTAAHGSVIVCTAFAPTSYWMVSTNSGASFLYIALPGITNRLNAVKYANGSFLAVGNGGTILKSPDGVSWEPRVSNTSADLNDVIYDGRWVAVGAGGRIVTSDDGEVFIWSAPDSSPILRAVATDGSKYVAVGTDGFFETSSNGVLWWNYGIVSDRESFRSIAYGNERFVATADGYDVKVSTNGISWQKVTLPYAGQRIVFSHGQFLIVNGALVLASSDGIRWSNLAPAGEQSFGAVSSSDGFFWLGSGNSTLYRGQSLFSLSGLRDTSGKFNLDLITPSAGNYRIETSPAMPASSWQTLVTLTNVNGYASWTDSNTPPAGRFYRARQE